MYKIIEDTNNTSAGMAIKRVEKKVIELIGEGWKTLGGANVVVVQKSANNIEYCCYQTMVSSMESTSN